MLSEHSHITVTVVRNRYSGVLGSALPRTVTSLHVTWCFGSLT